jgi:hypothetical protein
MTNTSGPGCCRNAEAKADERAAAAQWQEKGCGCRGGGRQAQARSTEAARATLAAPSSLWVPNAGAAADVFVAPVTDDEQC